jgi:hypothetical protein
VIQPLSRTALAARQDAERRAAKEDPQPERVDGDLVCKVANLMRDRRVELLAEPLDRCWERIALTVIKKLTEEGRLR